MIPLFRHPRAVVYPDRLAWESARTPAGEFRIGASIVSTILTDPWAALATLTGQDPEPDRATRIAWARGHLYEEAIIGHYALLTDRPALPIGPAMGGVPGSLVIIRHRSESWLAASPDGATVDPELGAGFVEAKDYVGGEWAVVDCVVNTCADYHPGVMPAGIYTQALVQIEAADIAYVDVARRMPNGGLRIIRVLRDDETQREIVESVADFRARYLLGGETLPADGSEACRRLLTRRFPTIGKELRAPTDEERARILELAEVKADIKALEAREAELANQLMESLGTDYGISLGGKAKAIRINLAGRETIDAAGLRAAHPEIAATFTRTGAPSAHIRLYNV